MTEARGDPAIRIEVTATRGSAPRDAGTAMRVTADAIRGTIGGGALEHRAIGIARDMLARGTTAQSRSFPLGPGLGQCCGGAVTLRFGRDDSVRGIDPVPGQIPTPATGPERPHPAALWIWGAGHVGRAVVRACPPQRFGITWVDDATERFPAPALAQTSKSGGANGNVTPILAADMPLFARHAPTSAHHLIFTYSHDIDLALCAALLRRGAASIGLIGSATKKARFDRRLRDMGLDPAPIVCPIGDKALGKAPADIARGTVAALVTLTEPQRASA